MPGWRGLRARLEAIVHQRCPRCFRDRVFLPGGWPQLRMSHAGPVCHVVYGREPGYFTGAMIVSYCLAVPLLALLALLAWWVTGWRFDLVLLVAGLSFLPFVPALLRYSRVNWMHFDRLVDPDPEAARYSV